MPAYRLDPDGSTISTRVSPSGTARTSAVVLRFSNGQLDDPDTGWVDVVVEQLLISGTGSIPPNTTIRLAIHGRTDGGLALELPVGDRTITLRAETRVEPFADGLPFTASGKVLIDPAILGVAAPAFLNTLVHVMWRAVWRPAD